MSDWKIDKLRGTCHKCEREFDDQQKVVSVISVQLDETVQRQDCCPECHERPNGEQSPAGEVYWETHWQKGDEVKRKVDFNMLLRIFEAWCEAPPPGQKALVYLIGLLLIRKRFFKMLDLVSQDGEEYLRLRRPGKEQEPFLVPAPLLSEAQLPPLRARLESLLDGALDEDDLTLSASSADDAPAREVGQD